MTFISRKYLVAAAAILACGIAHAGVKTSSVVTTGIGPTEEEATASALAKAVSQVNGVSSSTSVSTGKSTIEAHGKKVDDGKTTTVDLSAAAGRTPDVRMRSSGKVSRYDVQSSTKLTDGTYKVVVKAYFDKHFQDAYKAPTAGSGKTRIAVFPPEVQASQGLGGSVGNDVRDALERSLIERSEFSVLDRQTLDSSLDELGLIGSSYSSAAEKTKLHNIRGADIILLPRVRVTRVDVSQPGSQMTGQASRYSTTTTIDIRAVVPATSEILFARVYPVQNQALTSDVLDQVTSQVAEEVAVQTGAARRGKSSRKTYSPNAAYDQQSSNQALPYSNNAGSQDGAAPQSEQGVKLPFDR